MIQNRMPVRLLVTYRRRRGRGRWFDHGDQVRGAAGPTRSVEARGRRFEPASADPGARRRRPAVADRGQRAVQRRLRRRLLGGRSTRRPSDPRLARRAPVRLQLAVGELGSGAGLRQSADVRLVARSRPATLGQRERATTCRTCWRCISTSARRPAARSTRSAPSSTRTCTSRSMPSSATPTGCTASTTST